MKITLGLGSNLGDRRASLVAAIDRLPEVGLRVSRISPAVESPALLPADAPSSWNRLYLNLAIECETECTPEQVRVGTVAIETALGRERGERWAPRPIDIDILLWGDEIISTPDLKIPHPELHRRGFVLTPLIFLEPRRSVPGLSHKTLLEWSSELSHHIPLWMGIVNVTPDSFSDGGRYTDWATIEPRVDEMLATGAHIIDLGGQSTRPDAIPISAAEEWSRLEGVLELVIAKVARFPLRPLISVDTYLPQVAEQALESGVDIINDVSGLTSPDMIDLAGSSGADWVAMHQLTLPVDRAVTLPKDRNPADEVEGWLRGRLEAWEAAGLDLDRIIFDPGIGFGKNALQSLELLRQAGRFRKHGLRTLIGHSRKSFLKSFSTGAARNRDLATLGASLQLIRQGVDILRVHNVADHISAYRGWAHVAG